VSPVSKPADKSPMTSRLAAEVIATTTLVVLVIIAAVTVAELRAQRDRARAECEARNTSEVALRDYHAIRRSYYAASRLADLEVMETRLLASMPPLPDCG
jgi:hypothetical protein